MDFTFRPIDQWPTNATNWERRRSPFKSSYGQTLRLLDRELSMLDAKHVVVMLALEERDIRRDGLPYARARPRHPGVILAFESKYGPLKYATDVFTTWEDNLRAIALGLEALRKVDRYGITKRGEQYTGWIAIESKTGEMTLEEARAIITAHGGYRAAAKALHPDNQATGSAHEFRRLQQARELLGAGA